MSKDTIDPYEIGYGFGKLQALTSKLPAVRKARSWEKFSKGMCEPEQMTGKMYFMSSPSC